MCPNEFLAWQQYLYCVLKHCLCFVAWDLLRNCVYGFESFCSYFLNKHPDCFVSPLQVSGSALESLFSQYKRSAAGKLDAINYSISRAAQLIKETVSTHHSGSGYRNQSVDSCQGDVHLKRKNTKSETILLGGLHVLSTCSRYYLNKMWLPQTNKVHELL